MANRLWRAAASGGAWLTVVMLLAPVGSPKLTRGPYLQSVTATSAILVWRTDTPGDSRVEYGMDGYTQSATDATAAIEHVITLTDLITGTAVMYRVLSDDVELAAGSFRTAVAPGQHFSFGVIGDSGIGSTAQYQVADRLVALDPDFVLHTGDVVYPSGQADGYDPYFFQPYQALLRRAPIFPSLGNHDYGTAGGQPYLEMFYLPHNNPADTERYYSFDWGNAHFVALDFNDGPSPDQLNWLQADLAAATQAWKFVFYHQAIYLVDKRAVLAPIFTANHVDVVFNGHDHDYERTVPIGDVVYIVSGGGGASLYGVLPQSFSAYVETIYHAVDVTIDGCTLSLQAVRPDGAVFDTLTLAKPCAAPTAEPTEPTGPPTLTPTLAFTPTGWIYLPIIWKE
jgi:3',5'-cyclic AMP phosphodiesterase CpdA